MEFWLLETSAERMELFEDFLKGELGIASHVQKTGKGLISCHTKLCHVGARAETSYCCIIRHSHEPVRPRLTEEMKNDIRKAYQERKSVADAQAACFTTYGDLIGPFFTSESTVRRVLREEQPVMPLPDEIVQLAEEAGATLNCLQENQRYVLITPAMQRGATHPRCSIVVTMDTTHGLADGWLLTMVMVKTSALAFPTAMFFHRQQRASDFEAFLRFLQQHDSEFFGMCILNVKLLKKLMKENCRSKFGGPCN